MTSGSLIGICMLLIWGGELPSGDDQYHTMWNFSTFFLMGGVILLLIFFFNFNGEYKRLKAEDVLHDANFVDDGFGSDTDSDFDENLPVYIPPENGFVFLFSHFVFCFCVYWGFPRELPKRVFLGASGELFLPV